MSRTTAISHIQSALNEAERLEAEAKRLGRDADAAWWGARSGGLRYAFTLLTEK